MEKLAAIRQQRLHPRLQTDAPPMTSAASVPVTAAPSGASGKLKLAVVTLVIVAAAELVGPVQFSVGPGKVALLPMLWALLIAAVWGLSLIHI